MPKKRLAGLTSKFGRVSRKSSVKKALTTSKVNDMSDNLKSKLFTFVLDFRGGTSISQVWATSMNQSCRKWVQQLDTKDIYGLGPKSIPRLMEQMLEELPVSINGVQNVWCMTALIRGQLALIHIIQTDPILV